jgi:acyl-CoA thioesterase-1
MLLPFLLAGVAGHRELNQGDGIHPNNAGERIVANNVWRSLAPILDSVSRAHSTP